MTRVFIAFCCTLALLGSPATALAQEAREARLLVTVIDQTGAVIPNAVVTAVRVDDPTKVLGPVKSNEKGLATFEKLVPGRYTIGRSFRVSRSGSSRTRGFAPATTNTWASW